MKSMRFQFGLRAAFLLVFVSALSTATYQLLNPAAELPEGWKRDEIIASAVGTNETVLDSDVLVWQIREDLRPLLIHSCIVWLHLRKANGKDCFRIAKVYKHPNGNGKTWGNRAWNLYKQQPNPWIVNPIRYQEDFDESPSDVQIFEFVAQTDFGWRLEQFQGPMKQHGMNYIAGRVLKNAWKRRTGKAFDANVPPEFLR